MSDIIERIKGLRYVHVPQASQLFEEAIAEIERLRLTVAELEDAIRRLADQDATLSVCEGNATVTMDATLTDEERQAIWTVAEAYAENDGDHECEKIARVMQQLWQRTK